MKRPFLHTNSIHDAEHRIEVDIKLGKTFASHRFKGIREGGVAENSSWYVFMQGKDGAFEAYPVEEWYNFKLVQRYKALSAEEAEKEFERLVYS